MTWLKGMLIALGAVLVLVIAILAALGLLTSGGGKEVRHISVGQRTITVSHYKGLSQESIGDGVKIMVDGHVITATPDAITIDGETQNFDPGQDVEISIAASGEVEAKPVSPETTNPDDDGGDAPPE